MKRLFSVILILVISSFCFSKEMYNTLSGGLGCFFDQATIEKQTAKGIMPFYFLSLDSTSFKDESYTVGFFLSTDTCLLSGSVIGYENGASASLVPFMLDTAFGPVFKTLNEDVLRIWVAPHIDVCSEFEFGKYKSKYSYSYYGILLGFGTDIQGIFDTNSHCAFTLGTSLSLFPFYRGIVSVNGYSAEVSPDSYFRFVIQCYAGIRFRRSH